MRWDLHGLTLDCEWNEVEIGERWVASFASRRVSQDAADLSFHLNLVSAVPLPPPGPPQFRQTGLLEYFVEGNSVVAHFPRYGQLQLNLSKGTTHGEIVPASLNTYGVFEDLVAIGLSPHLRRMQRSFLIHAFAAAPPYPTPLRRPTIGPAIDIRAVLIVGHIGSGKTTTGISLLDAGWKLLSNDSPITQIDGRILSYPGLLAAYPDSLSRFASTRPLGLDASPSRKITFAAESIWPDVWIEQARPGAILFPQIEQRTEHVLEPLSQHDALRLLLPHAIEQWDAEMIPIHLELLSQIARVTPAFRLRLGSEMETLPAVIASTLTGADAPYRG